MFETLFTHGKVIRKHAAGPLGPERAAYLRGLADLGYGRRTLLHRAAYVLCVARELMRWPPDYRFTLEEVDAIASKWACKRPRAKSPQRPKVYFRFEATEFLGFLDRLVPEPEPSAGRYEAQLDEFIRAQREDRGLSEATCRGLRWQMDQFLAYIENQGIDLAVLNPTHIDGFFQLMSQRWGRHSLHQTANTLRTWFRYAESLEWVMPGLVEAVAAPRIYREEDVPLGPTWKHAQEMVDEADTDQPKDLRDRAILLLILVYGFRSDEVRRLSFDDLDWKQDRIRFRRAKSYVIQTFPIEPIVGNALATYIRSGRPKTQSRVIFLTVRAPFRPLSSGGVYNVVRPRVDRTEFQGKGRGPHGLRHACARKLIDDGRNLRIVGDHLGHRSASSTRIYTKVDLASLRRVAFEDLGGLR